MLGHVNTTMGYKITWWAVDAKSTYTGIQRHNFILVMAAQCRAKPPPCLGLNPDLKVLGTGLCGAGKVCVPYPQPPQGLPQTREGGDTSVVDFNTNNNTGL